MPKNLAMLLRKDSSPKNNTNVVMYAVYWGDSVALRGA